MASDCMADGVGLQADGVAEGLPHQVRHDGLEVPCCDGH